MAKFTRMPITWSIKQIFTMMLTLKFLFGHLVQRGYVWERARKVNLIMSIIEDYSVPPIYTRKNEDGTYDVLDGKQRMEAIYGFIQNEYSLVDVEPVELEVMVTREDDTKAIEVREYDLNGLYYKNLPQEIQDRIMNYRLSFVHYENITEDEVRKLFLKLNSGKALSTKAMNIANCRDLYTVADIANHPFFDSILTEKGKADRKGIPMVVKIHEMLTTPIDEICFKSADFNDTMASVDISNEMKATIRSILDMAFRVYGLFGDSEKMARRKFSAETNFVSLIPFLAKALDEGISDEMFHDFIVANFSAKASVSDAYASASRSGSASTISIMTRHSELEKAWSEFFTIDGDVADVIEVTEEEAPAPITDHQEYRYGMRLRGFAPMCQPMDGFIRQEDDEEGRYHDILVYDRELSGNEIAEYELDVIA